jgi:hypothetical protein
MLAHDGVTRRPNCRGRSIGSAAGSFFRLGSRLFDDRPASDAAVPRRAERNQSSNWSIYKIASATAASSHAPSTRRHLRAARAGKTQRRIAAEGAEHDEIGITPRDGFRRGRRDIQ